MKLYTLLKDRASINILKILSETETVEKKYSISYDEVLDRLAVSERDDTLLNLQAGGLVSAEQSENNGMVLSITQKGKDFVSHFDKLIEVMNGKKQEARAYQVKYDLAEMEKKILLISKNVFAETGELVELNSLAAEIYPMQDITGKVDEVSENARRLEEMNLLERLEAEDATYFDVTDTGSRVVREQFKNSNN